VAQLLVRDIDESVVEALRIRAVRNGRSAEAEHREILREVLLGQHARGLKQHLLAMPDVGEDADFEAPRLPARKIDL
jgi:plasmid stability protein